MAKYPNNQEPHLIQRIGWVRAAVLGANDGILSTASLLSGIVASGASHSIVILSGISAMLAGATSMATGEYISVSSQSDIEEADIEREKRELATNRKAEQQELAQIYVERGLDRSLSNEVAVQMMAHDALEAHARDELGLSEMTKPRPMQAAFSSAASFGAGAMLPLLVAIFSSPAHALYSIPAMSLLFLILLGYLSARIGGAPCLKPILRIVLWGAFSMLVTGIAGHYFQIS